ncbi:hypothetical protein ACQKCJ_16355 [Flavobacterium sp. NPDC079362]|uniref:hypothetical protein n=1 Tax=Flavobacterium sp. NPDC079362 TaxID=3390566 RepID=UPI003CFCB2C9
MSKNAIHNFNLSIQNSADIKASEDLTKTIIKELAKVSKEMSQQKDIVQEWQEQKKQNAAAIANNTIASTEGGAIDTTAEIKKTALSIGNTPLVSGGTVSNLDVSSATISLPTTSTSGTLIGGDVIDTTGRTTRSSATSDNTTPPTSGAESNTLNFSSGTTTQTYTSVAAQETLTVSQTLQTNNNEPKTEVVRAEIKKRLEAAMAANNTVETAYWRNIAKAFDEGATAKDFDGKPDDMLFTKMYDQLKQSAKITVESQNFNWETVRQKMIEAIDANILNGTISVKNKTRWETIKKQLGDDKTNIANLFEQYDELFLLLKEVEGLSALPNTITITTKTKIYPNLSADQLYASIGREDVYVFLREINNEEIRGSAVDKGAVKIKNTTAKSFIIGESLEFFLDEKFINQNLYKKEDINWIVRNVQNKKDEGIVFVNEGTSFSYNFDTAGVYRIDAYGYKPTIKGSKNAGTSTFIELEIVAQQIEIKSPFKDSFTRASVKEQLFKVNLKNTKVKTLNPLKLYYQLEKKTANKVTEISEELELDAGGIIKLALPELGEYKIKVTSKDQYALSKESKISVIKNEVTSIGYVKDASATGVFLLGDPNRKLTLEAKTFKINPPTDEEKEDVKWMIYDANNKPYLSPGTAIMNKDKNPKKEYFHQWGFYDVPIPQKVGNYTVEAYSDIQKGSKSNSIFKIEVKQPQVTAAYWAWSGGSKKITSGFSGESNWIKAAIPYYSNQTVRIYFYLNNKKTKHYLDVKTNGEGVIFKEIKFDSDFRKLIGFENGKIAKIGFKLLGIQNGKPCPFKVPANYESDTLLSVTTYAKILDAYFMYDSNRVTTQDEIPFGENGAVVTIVAKTQNMVGKEIVLTAHKVGEKPTYSNAVIINSEGVAITSFILKNLNKKLKKGTKIKYYVGIEGYSTKHLTDKLLTMVMGVGTNKDNEEILDENDPQLIWGSKVSKEFRVKVVQICKNIEKQKGIPFSPNVLMNIIAFETNLSFSPKAGTFGKIMDDNKKAGFVGLIQFGIDASKDLKVKRSVLFNMTAEEQLDYVEKWFLLKSKNELKTATDIYLSVNYPTAAGIGHLDNEVVYGDPKAAYRANKPFLREADEIDENGKSVGKDGGKTYVWEVREALEENEIEGQYSKNTVLMNKSYSLIMSNPKEIFNLDTSLTFCYFSARQIKEIRKLIDKLQTNEEKIKAYRILQYFAEYNSQRDAKYKKLADTMCNVTSESIALQYLGQMNPAPDPNMKMEDFMMTMIRDILKQGDDSRYEANTRVKIANELGIKGGFIGVGGIYDKKTHKKMLEDKLNKGYGVCMSLLGHIVRVVDVNDIGIIVDDPYGKIQSFKIRKEKGNKGGYNGGKNYSNNSILKGESNLWLWEQLKKDKIKFNYYEWYYL